MVDIIGKDTITTLINGVCERNFRSKEARLERLCKYYLQQRQEMHEEKMQWNEHQFLIEMQKKEHIFQIKQQYRAFEKARQGKLRDEFEKNGWPLMISPELYLKILKDNYPSGVSPLNIIIFDDPSQMKDVDVFFSKWYADESMSPVFERSGDLKVDFLVRKNGTALVQNLWLALKLPTLLIIPNVNDAKFVLNVRYWGMFDKIKPAYFSMFSMNMEKLKLFVLRQVAKEQRNVYLGMGKKCPVKSNAYIWQQEESLINKKREEGVDEKIIQKFCDDVYGKKYSDEDKEIKGIWEQEKTNHISWLIELSGCIIADMYFLCENDTPPKFSYLLNNIPAFFVGEKNTYIDFIENVFMEMVAKERQLLFERMKKSENTSEETLISIDVKTNNPFLNRAWDLYRSKRLGNGFPALHAALVAKEFDHAGIREKSKRFVDWAVHDLEENIDRDDAIEDYRKVIDILTKLEGDGDGNKRLNKIALRIEDRKKTIDEEIRRKELRRCGIAVPGEDWKVNLEKGIVLEMVWVESGTFYMGSDDSKNEKPAHKVNITKGYWIGKYQLTQEQWTAIDVEREKKNFFKKGGLYPVESISWDEANKFCDALNKKFKDMLPEGYHFGLPTEAQWEFAARGGVKSNGYLYSGSNNIDEVAWFNENSTINDIDGKEKGIKMYFFYSRGCTSHPIGQKMPNELGIYDMSGNVWEWCLDRCERGKDTEREEDASVKTKTYIVKDNGIDDPYSEKGSLRVVRGGSWQDPARHCRSTHRFYCDPSFFLNFLGFRVALVPDK